jgi:hypothetical protein
MADIGARMDINRRRNSGVRLSALVFIILVLAVVAAFAPALQGTFLNWDDDRNFVENTAYRGIGPAQLAWAWRTYHLGVWQPLAWVLLGAEWCVSGLQPRFYHVVSLAIHALNCMMLYLIIVQILSLAPQDSQWRYKASDRIFAAAATIHFAVHPLRVEAVAWISAQPYLPAALFYLLAIFAVCAKIGVNTRRISGDAVYAQHRHDVQSGRRQPAARTPDFGLLSASTARLARIS